MTPVSSQAPPAPDTLRVLQAQLSKERVLYAFFAMQLVTMVLFMKLGFPVADSVVELALPLNALFFGAIFYRKIIGVDAMRMVLFAAFSVLAALSQVLGGQEFSLPSVLLCLAIFLPFVFRVDVSTETYNSCLSVFQNIMVVVCCIVFFEHAVQISIGAKYWPSMDSIIPQGLLFQHYVYIQPIVWQSPYNKPNAFVFLEVSYVAQFIAIAIVIELVLWQRPIRLMFYVATMFATFAGTGFVVLLLAAPLLVTKISRRMLLVGFLGLGVVAAILLSTGWFATISHRLGEFNQAGSSADGRFISPIRLLWDFMQRPDALFVGIGAGNLAKGVNITYLMVTKIPVEYGLMAGIAYYIFFCYAMFVGAPSYRIAWALFIFDNLLGGSFTPLHANLCMLLCTLMRVRRDEVAPAGLLQEAARRYAATGGRRRRVQTRASGGQDGAAGLEAGA